MSEKILEKPMKITLKDDRVVYGILYSMDKESNLII